MKYRCGIVRIIQQVSIYGDFQDDCFIIQKIDENHSHTAYQYWQNICEGSLYSLYACKAIYKYIHIYKIMLSLYPCPITTWEFNRQAVDVHFVNINRLLYDP